MREAREARKSHVECLQGSREPFGVPRDSGTLRGGTREAGKDHLCGLGGTREAPGRHSLGGTREAGKDHLDSVGGTREAAGRQERTNCTAQGGTREAVKDQLDSLGGTREAPEAVKGNPVLQPRGGLPSVVLGYLPSKGISRYPCKGLAQR